MGAGSTLANVLLFLTALERVLGQGRLSQSRARRRRGGRRSGGRALKKRRRRRSSAPRLRTAGRVVLAMLAFGFGSAAYAYLTLPDVRVLRTQNPTTTAFIELREPGGRRAGARRRAGCSAGCLTTASRRT